MPETASKVALPLYDLAHARAGDKGDTLSICVIAYDRADYALIGEQATPERVAAHFGDDVKGAVRRYDLPRLGAYNFVLEQALAGGVSKALTLDTHGKAKSGTLLAMTVEVPQDHPAAARNAEDRRAEDTSSK